MSAFDMTAVAPSGLVTLLAALTTLIFLALRGRFIIKVDGSWPPLALQSKRNLKLPAGPVGVPVLGNLLEFSRARDTGKLGPYLASMARYGEMTTLRLGSRTWILLNSDRVATDIIAKKSRITSERPTMPIASDLVSNGKRTVIRQTAHWQEGRRVMHHLLSGSTLRTYGDWYETESIMLLAAYLERPKSWYTHHYRYATSVLYRLVMGRSLDKTTQELDEYQKVTMEFIFSLNRHFVDFFPWLARLPSVLQFWASPWRNMGELHRKVFSDWWSPIEAAVNSKQAGPSFVRDTLLHPETKYKGDREEAMYLATSVIAAGGDNTRMTLNTFFMAMISYPSALQRLQAELDTLCGAGDNLRLPNISDMSSLPFCAALVKEVLRWRPTVPLVPQHHLTEAFEYEGYTFPAGVDFLINNIALQYSEWDDVNEFRPERFIDGIGSEANPTLMFWGFGGGRRVCVGYRVAQQALFVAYARTAYCFNLLPNGEFENTRLNHQSLKEPFPVKTIPRSSAHRKLILEEVRRVQERSKEK